MYIHRPARLIYLAHPRTASVATSADLKRVGFEKLEPPSDHHSQLWDDGTPVTEANRGDWTVFTTIRNHFDAAVSWVLRKYSTRGGEPRAWDTDAFAFALGDSNRWVTENRMWSLHADDADVLVRYEELEGGIGDVLEDAGLPRIGIRRHNVSENRRGRPYQEFYTPVTRAYIEDRFGEEMARFGYTFEEALV